MAALKTVVQVLAVVVVVHRFASLFEFRRETIVDLINLQ